MTQHITGSTARAGVHATHVGTSDAPLSEADAAAQLVMRATETSIATNGQVLENNLVYVRDHAGKLMALKKAVVQHEGSPVAAIAQGIVTLPGLAHPGYLKHLKSVWSGQKETVYSTHLTPEEQAEAKATIDESYAIQGQGRVNYDTRTQHGRATFARTEYEANPERFTKIEGKGLFTLDAKKGRMVLVPQKHDGSYDFENTRSFVARDAQTGELITDIDRLNRTAYQVTEGLDEIMSGYMKAVEDKYKALLSDKGGKTLLTQTMNKLIYQFGYDKMITQMQERSVALEAEINKLSDEQGELLEVLTRDKAKLDLAIDKLNQEHERLDDLAEQAGEAYVADPPTGTEEAFDAARGELQKFKKGAIQHLLDGINKARDAGDNDEANEMILLLNEEKARAQQNLDTLYRNWSAGTDGIPKLSSTRFTPKVSSPQGSPLLVSLDVAATLHEAGYAYEGLMRFIDLRKSELHTTKAPEERLAIQETIKTAYESANALVADQSDAEALAAGKNARTYVGLYNARSACEGTEYAKKLTDYLDDLRVDLSQADTITNEINDLPTEDQPAATSRAIATLQTAVKRPDTYQPLLQGDDSVALVSKEARFMQMQLSQLESSESYHDVRTQIRQINLEANIQIDEKVAEIKTKGSELNAAKAAGNQTETVTQLSAEITQLKAQINEIKKEAQETTKPLKTLLPQFDKLSAKMQSQYAILGDYEQGVIDSAKEDSNTKKKGQVKAGSALSKLFHSYGRGALIDQMAQLQAADWKDVSDSKSLLKESVQAFKPVSIVISPKQKEIRVYNQTGVKWDEKKQTFVNAVNLTDPTQGVSVKMNDSYWKRVENSYKEGFGEQMQKGRIEKGQTEKKGQSRSLYVGDAEDDESQRMVQSSITNTIRNQG